MDIKQKQLYRRLGFGFVALVTFVAAGYFVSKYATNDDAAAKPKEEEVLKVVPSKDDLKNIEENAAKKQAEQDKAAALEAEAIAKKAAESAPKVEEVPKELNVSNIEFKPITPTSYFIRASVNNQTDSAVDWPELQVSVTYGSEVIGKKIINKDDYLAGLKMQGVVVPGQIKANDKYTVSANVHFDEMSVKPDGFKVKVFAPE